MPCIGLSPHLNLTLPALCFISMPLHWKWFSKRCSYLVFSRYLLCDVLEWMQNLIHLDSADFPQLCLSSRALRHALNLLQLIFAFKRQNSSRFYTHGSLFFIFFYPKVSFDNSETVSLTVTLSNYIGCLFRLLPNFLQVSFLLKDFMSTEVETMTSACHVNQVCPLRVPFCP